MTTTATETRCSHCRMPVEAAADGRAVDHDYPYAVATFGQCKGSGKPILLGPGTPPAVWGSLNDKTYVDIGVLPAPMPTVRRDGWTVTITGVRFTHSMHCWKCGCLVSVATEDGTMRLGFDDKGRSWQRDTPGPGATYDGPCPNGCGTRVVMGGLRFPQPGRPTADGHTVAWREWDRLRHRLEVWTPDMTPADLARLRSKR